MWTRSNKCLMWVAFKFGFNVASLFNWAVNSILTDNGIHLQGQLIRLQFLVSISPQNGLIRVDGVQQNPIALIGDSQQWLQLGGLEFVLGKWESIKENPSLRMGAISISYGVCSQLWELQGTREWWLLFTGSSVHPLGMLVSRATYFRGQEQVLGLAHEPVVLLGGQRQASRFVAEEGKVQHHQRIACSTLLTADHATGPFEGHKRVLHVVQLT